MTADADSLEEIGQQIVSELGRLGIGIEEHLSISDTPGLGVDLGSVPQVLSFPRDVSQRHPLVVATVLRSHGMTAEDLRTIDRSLTEDGILVLVYVDKGLEPALDKPAYWNLAQSIRAVGDHEYSIFVLQRREHAFPIAPGQSQSKVTLIVPCHNYGRFLPEAVASVLAQSKLPAEIILSDDASTDDSAETMRAYAARFPDLITVNVNDENLGIEAHFNKVVAMAKGDYVLLLGADNRIPTNYVERLSQAFEDDEQLAVAYTDFQFFGARARTAFEGLREDFRGVHLRSDSYTSSFPDFSAESRRLLDQGINFIHGSSMFRRSVFDTVGGYASRDEGAEDKVLFRKMLDAGWTARKVNETFLEYRQHSPDQANHQFSYFAELSLLRAERHRLAEQHRADVEVIRQQKVALLHLRAVEQEHRRVLESWSFRLGYAIVRGPSRLKAWLTRSRRP